MHYQVHNLMPESVIATLVGRISHDEEAPLGMDPTSPRLQFAKVLEFLPVFRTLKDINVRLGLGSQRFPFQIFHDDAIIELGLDRNRRRNITVHEMVDEVLGLGVFPLFGVNRERLFSQWVGVALAQLRERHFRQGMETSPCRRYPERKTDEHNGKKANHRALLTATTMRDVPKTLK